ncbi:MAG: GNAT family N-acetyltransferase [Bacteroidales bacterium]|nr:GNAT family N-acetyltransferase [Bacteroidales bacterium]MCF8339100.1 GNAT family N-acetyltransferase [Bacteroidales bacterium]
MQEIIKAVDRQVLKSELTNEKFVRKTNNGEREIYVVTHHNSPNLMLEVGRLREISFREAGGGTGKEADIDFYDRAEVPFKQLIVWDNDDEEIVGGYRFIEGYKIPLDKNNVPLSATSKLFHFSDVFISNYLNQTIELGRSFVQPRYQPNVDRRKGLYSLDNLWDGLGALIIDNPESKYFFGKFTMYPSFDRYARDVILHFLHYYFLDEENLVYAYEPLGIEHDIHQLNSLFTFDSYENDYRKMVQEVRNQGENIPPLVNSYMNLSPTMKVFGTALNPSFGNVEETAILIKIEDIYESKKKRHISNYKNTHEE